MRHLLVSGDQGSASELALTDLLIPSNRIYYH